MRRPEGFTSRRRRYLAKKVDRLDRLENRTTMTEPISAVGLLMGSLRWLDQLGIVDKRMLGNPVSGLAPLDQVSAPGQAQRRNRLRRPIQPIRSWPAMSPTVPRRPEGVVVGPCRQRLSRLPRTMQMSC